METMGKLNIGTLDMSQDEQDWLRVIAALNGDTMKSVLVQAWRGHLTSRKQHYVRKIDYLARSLNLTWEQTYVLLLNKSQPFKDEDLEWARSQPPLAIKEQELLCDYFHPSHPPQSEPNRNDDCK